MQDAGFIYAFRTLGTSIIKVGRTSNTIQVRQRQLEGTHFVKLELIATVTVPENLAEVEREVLMLLHAIPHSGEWFTMCLDAVALEALVAQALQNIAERSAKRALEHQWRWAKASISSEQFLKDVGYRIRRRRMACGLLQKDLAERIHWPQGHVSRLEKGEFLSVRLEKLIALADALGTSTDYLLGRTHEAGDVPNEFAAAATA